MAMVPKMKSRYVLSFSLILSTSLVVMTVEGATISVGGLCTLQNAIIAANQDNTAGGTCTAGSGPDDIVLQPGGHYLLGQVDNTTDGKNGLPAVTSEITIIGNDSVIERDAAALAFRIFYIASNGNLTLRSLTVKGGSAQRFPSALPDSGGGGLYNNGGTLTLDHVTLTNNRANISGGGLFNSSGGIVTLTYSTVSANVAESSGGGLANSSSPDQSSVMVIENSLVYRNQAETGGGVTTRGLSITNLINSTVSGNSASAFFGGSGLESIVSSTVTLLHSTVADNWSIGGAGAVAVANDSRVISANSIVADNVGGDCNGDIIDTGHNWFEDSTCGRAGNGDPALDPLAYNGGPTQTHALLSSSGAIDAAGDCTALPIGISIDQRGVTRPQRFACDIGAYEFVFSTSPVPEPVPALSWQALAVLLFSTAATGLFFVIIQWRRHV
jgi:hypothetical protein